MKTSILDTDVLSEYFRGNQTVVNKVNVYIEEYGSINISIITYYEILNGLLYKDAKKQLSNFKDFAKYNTIISLTEKSVEISAIIFADLRKIGKEIGHTDTLIAGIAISNEMDLITNNTNHFNRIKNLQLGNWFKLV